jgi:hypothetical protein
MRKGGISGDISAAAHHGERQHFHKTSMASHGKEGNLLKINFSFSASKQTSDTPRTYVSNEFLLESQCLRNSNALVSSLASRCIVNIVPENKLDYTSRNGSLVK